MPEFAPLPIIRTKLHAPQGLRDQIVRQRLLKASPIGAKGSATLVSAPAGYGKSTFVAQGVAASGLRCAWLSLDPPDSDLRRFASYVLAAIRTAFPNSCSNTADCLRMPTLYSSEVLAGLLCNDAEGFDEPLILVLDDYHHVVALEVHDFVSEILRRPPPNLHLVIVTRRDPPLLLQSLRAAGALAEVRMRHLAFTQEEAQEFVRACVGELISEHAVLLLNERTEGWPAALRLATLAVPDSGLVDDFVDRIPGDTHEVREYLLQEVLAKSSPSLREYLLHTAFVDRFCASLCEALLPQKTLAEVGDSEVLSGDGFIARIRDSGFFAIALDSRSKWYRYHHLFQSMLQDQARSKFGSEEVCEIHVRAARWFEARDLFEEAIRHLLWAGRAVDAAELMVRHRDTIMNSEQWHRLDGWLKQLPPELSMEMPALLLLKARQLRTAGSREEFEQTLEKAASLLETTSIADEFKRELYGSLESARCYQLYMNSDGAGAVKAARRALELLPATSLAERGFAMIILGGALQMMGDVEAARKTLHAAASGGADVGAVPVALRCRLLLALCFVHWMQGDLVALEASSREAFAIATSADLKEAQTVASSFRAGVLYHRDELAAVLGCLQGLLSSKAIANAEFHAQNLIISSLAYQELGDTSAANDGVRMLRELAFETHNSYLIALSEAFSAEMAIRQGRLTEALSWADAADPDIYTPNYAFYFPTLTLVKALVLDDTPASLERAGLLLDKLVSYLARIHNRRFLIEALALRAMLRVRTGTEAAAATDLEAAIAMALPARFIRVFVDLGPRMGHMMNRLDLDLEGLAYVGEILAAFREDRAAPGSEVKAVPVAALHGGVEALSRRELQILTLFAQRLSNKEAATTLNISDVTVKRHAANIYQKLGVHGRRQAVAKAEGLGIFDQPDEST